MELEYECIVCSHRFKMDDRNVDYFCPNCGSFAGIIVVNDDDDNDNDDNDNDDSCEVDESSKLSAPQPKG